MADQRSQTDVVIEAIKQMLTSGRIAPGAKLPIEGELATLLGVSRSSLREGVRALAALGILETRQGDGTYVTALDPSALLRPLEFFADVTQASVAAELLAVRRVLEQESAALAASRVTDEQIAELESILRSVDDVAVDADEGELERFIEADSRFHGLIASIGGNASLAAMIDALTSRTTRARLWRAISERGSVASTHAEHASILRALSQRDAERARIRMATHLLGVEEFAASVADDQRDDQ